VSSRPGTGKSLSFFYSVCVGKPFCTCLRNKHYRILYCEKGERADAGMEDGNHKINTRQN
jgi:hypothetical protein